MKNNNSGLMDDLVSVSKQLMVREPFYGYFLIGLNKIFESSLPTAGVSKNGINCQLYVNPDFWMGMTRANKLAVLKHELLHIVFFHLMEQDRYADNELFNIAADLEINQYIEEEYKKGWIGMELSNYPELNLPVRAGTRVYYDLLTEVNKNRQAGDNQPGGQGPKGTGEKGEVTSNDLKEWFDQVKNGGTGSGNDGSSPEKSKVWDVYDAMKRGETTQCSHESWKEFMDGLSEADKKLIKKQIDYQIKELVNNDKDKSKGFIPGELKQYIDDLFKIKKPVIDWKSQLRRFVGNGIKTYTKKTRHKPNNRFKDNPALKVKLKKHILVGIDTSGSVSNKELEEFFSEIHHMYKTGVSIDIVECDASIGATYAYVGKTPKYITGRGGTEFQPVIDHFNNNHHKYTVLVYLTDMGCSPPTKTRNPMLWVSSSNGPDIDKLDRFYGAKVKITKTVNG